MSCAVIALPGGLWRDGVRHRAAALRPLTGADEAFLLEEAAALLPAQRATALLARCVERLGPWEEVTPDAVRALSVGDREALLLHLRRLTLGERIECVLRCPEAACGEKMDLDLAVSDLLFPPYPDAAPWYEAELGEPGEYRKVRFRLPTGADQEEAALLALTDINAAAGRLLRRCLENDPSAEISLKEGDAERLGALMAERDPQAELVLQLTCPICARDFETPFDTAAFFLQELAGRSAILYREVHRLALAYHWSQAEILSLSGRQRRLYLELLAETGGAAR
jgi:hypothetical protein